MRLKFYFYSLSDGFHKKWSKVSVLRTRMVYVPEIIGKKNAGRNPAESTCIHHADYINCCLCSKYTFVGHSLRWVTAMMVFILLYVCTVPYRTYSLPTLLSM